MNLANAKKAFFSNVRDSPDSLTFAKQFCEDLPDSLTFAKQFCEDSPDSLTFAKPFCEDSPDLPTFATSHFLEKRHQNGDK
jgi:transposase